MSIDNQLKQKRIDDSRELYLKYEGRQHELIEKEMRLLGYHDFHRRILYSRFERGRHRPGWIGRFGWERLLTAELRIENGELRMEGEKPARNSQFSILNSQLTNGFDEFVDWLKRVSPALTWDWKHQVYIYKRLRRVTTGERTEASGVPASVGFFAGQEAN